MTDDLDREQAQAAEQVHALEIVTRATAHDWRLAAEFLARPWPERWGPSQYPVPSVAVPESAFELDPHDGWAALAWLEATSPERWGFATDRKPREV